MILSSRESRSDVGKPWFLHSLVSSSGHLPMVLRILYGVNWYVTCQSSIQSTKPGCLSWNFTCPRNTGFFSSQPAETVFLGYTIILQWFTILDMFLLALKPRSKFLLVFCVLYHFLKARDVAGSKPFLCLVQLESCCKINDATGEHASGWAAVMLSWMWVCREHFLSKSSPVDILSHIATVRDGLCHAPCQSHKGSTLKHLWRSCCRVAFPLHVWHYLA